MLKTSDVRFMEYYYVDYNTKCVKNCSNASAYPSADSNCGDLANNKDCWCSKEQTKQEGCYYTESPANNFIALRDFEEGHNLLYSEFQTGELQKELLQHSTPTCVPSGRRIGERLVKPQKAFLLFKLCMALVFPYSHHTARKCIV